MLMLIIADLCNLIANSVIGGYMFSIGAVFCMDPVMMYIEGAYNISQSIIPQTSQKKSTFSRLGHCFISLCSFGGESIFCASPQSVLQSNFHGK